MSLLINFLMGTVISVFIYYTIKYAIIHQRNKVFSNKEKKDNTGFVTDTFQSLVKQLKQKEEELQKLRMMAEQRAEEIESYNEDILRSITTGVISINQDRKITTFNQSAEKILCLKREEVIGRYSGDVFEKENPIFNLIERSLSQQILPKRVELELSKKDNSRIWVGVSTSLLKHKDDKVIGVTLVFTDLTEIKNLQEEIEIKKRLSLIGEMSAGIAHEFRNFMGTIYGFSKMLSKKVDQDDPRQDLIKGITNEVETMEKLISELLDFGKETRLSLQPVDLKELIKKVTDQILEIMKEKQDVKIFLNIPDEPAIVEIDEILMRQAFSNLIQNGIESMESGGELRVSINTNDPYLNSRWIEIKISDTGIGIPGDKMDKIFLPFFTTKKRGTGLGLALVHKIIISHKGKIEVKSQEGLGTTFKIYLPLKGG